MTDSNASSTRALSLQRLFELVDYDPGTGRFTWRARRAGCRPGSKAGTLDGRGYLRLRLDDHQYYASQLAWLYVFGVWPSCPLCRRDGNNANNAIDNFYLVDAPDHRPAKLGLQALSSFLDARAEEQARQQAEQQERRAKDQELRARAKALAHQASAEASRVDNSGRSLRVTRRTARKA